MTSINTKYGIIEGISHIDYYEDHRVKECKLNKANELKTPYGILVPQYEDADERRKHIVSVSFHNNDNIKSISLQHQVEIDTPIGTLPAEFVTFYENGNINRLFPLNGKLTAYWTEQDELTLAKDIDFDIPIGKFSKKIISVHFYKDRSLKSITLWPKNTVTLQTSIGDVVTRIGVSFYPDGKIKSLEPDDPIAVKTSIGTISAYKSDAVGIHGDSNSLRFSDTGQVEALITSTDRIEVIDKNGSKKVYSPGLKRSVVDDETMEIVPLSIEFHNNKVRFNNSPEHEYDIDEYLFNIKSSASFKAKSLCAACSSCLECSGGCS
ncbi:hypothetical protein [Clostridium sp. DJ247]|uniref:hypothetical protein n=1 Tax=Clostridium sp. DJ247 TaxID=2726188 RepID=UPI001629509B|nr:hypothetical protein [Clostridium sp. DJ247]MBC2581486.1 hypothetical protein [Clostridium sp. DJ247]